MDTPILSVSYFSDLTWPGSGAMGYGLPAAIAAKLRYPGRIVTAFAGDGCILMYGQELATAMKYSLPVIVSVV
jgi:acetolactate synthase-1/2/3 large subunit